ncbi:hypothetical protein VTN31DRAFT_4140 [Thermomyces dupontii]|uniref:uncharacterized protein n=1 Tax=Talaromyces thermophilus TaxID=28565 RepID=UPI0037441819
MTDEAATTTPTTMVTPASAARTSTLLANLSTITARISQASSKRPQHSRPDVRLVAVSKLKPASDILALHNAHPDLHFGENYVQELLEKARLLPASIKWHFIGGLQSNKCVTLARDVPGLWAVESVDTEKKASLLNRGWGERPRPNNNNGQEQEEERLRVYVQVNTSAEPNKSGVEPSAAPALCRFIREQCPRLKLQGLMTIGAIARSTQLAPGQENEDFVTLVKVREAVEQDLGLQSEGEDRLELSMGMSADFESAIRLGSDEVRIGTDIFGERPPKSEAKIL